MPLKDRLMFCIEHDFERITYTEAVEILKNSTPNKKGKFQFPVQEWGIDLQSEHERYLVEKHFKTSYSNQLSKRHQSILYETE